MCLQKMAKFQSDFIRLSVCLSTILEFHNKRLLFLDHHCIIALHQLSDHIFEIVQDLTEAEISGNTQTNTQTDYYNPPPMLGLITILKTTVE